MFLGPQVPGSVTVLRTLILRVQQLTYSAPSNPRRGIVLPSHAERWCHREESSVHKRTCPQASLRPIRVSQSRETLLQTLRCRERINRRHLTATCVPSLHLKVSRQALGTARDSNGPRVFLIPRKQCRFMHPPTLTHPTKNLETLKIYLLAQNYLLLIYLITSTPTTSYFSAQGTHSLWTLEFPYRLSTSLAHMYLHSTPAHFVNCTALLDNIAHAPHGSRSPLYLNMLRMLQLEFTWSGAPHDSAVLSLCSNNMLLSGARPMHARMMFTRHPRCANSAFTMGVPGGTSGALMKNDSTDSTGWNFWKSVCPFRRTCTCAKPA